MPTPLEIRTAMKTKIEGLANMGLVHAYERYAAEPAKLKALYVSGAPARLLGWTIRKVSTREFLEDIARWRVVHGWRIRGLMAWDDAEASETLFDEKVEAIRDAFRTDDSLGGLIMTCIDPDSDEVGVQVLDQRPALFAGVLCHHAELGLQTQHVY